MPYEENLSLPPISPCMPSLLELVFLCAGYFKVYFHPRLALAPLNWAALWGRMAGEERWWAPAPAWGHRAGSKYTLPVITFKTLPHSSQWPESQTGELGMASFNCGLLWRCGMRPWCGVVGGMREPRIYQCLPWLLGNLFFFSFSFFLNRAVSMERNRI